MKISKRKLAEFRDAFRRRKVEKPHLVGAYKKSQVLIRKPEIISIAGQEVFQATIVNPRLGTGLAPYHDHVTATAMQMAAHQTVVSCFKKFKKVNGYDMPTVDIKLRLNKKAPLSNKLLVQVEETKSTDLNGAKFKTFKCQIIDANTEAVYSNGSFMIAMIPKNKK
ncbi:MAG: hypothetical protein CL944_01175 [Candidatus Diapherotrites archaeon]|uniref:Uncharacterized protein n=1 Tax=Candidatus Iainarchaeum sp. TaxID=3101447 RepID=A0A2D6LPF7_9ARCH|nr:hypothetical protein [Candidatus Diapherotrites archaeon]|tara:strand:- start:8493 stop:8990 length:498 start_codon:yes stop_codon:yes gene_type:complete